MSKPYRLDNPKYAALQKECDAKFDSLEVANEPKDHKILRVFQKCFWMTSEIRKRNLG